MAASGVFWLAFAGAVLFFAVAVFFAVLLTVRDARGFSLHSALPKALNKAVIGVITLAVTGALFGAGKLFHISHADLLSAPLVAAAVAFLQPEQRRQFKPAVSALALGLAAIVFADVLHARGVAHPIMFTFAATVVVGCAIPLYRQVRPIARCLWLGL